MPQGPLYDPCGLIGLDWELNLFPAGCLSTTEEPGQLPDANVELPRGD